VIAWTGWSLAQVLGLFAGVGAAVVGLYFLKLRRRAVPVPFLPLWDALVVDERRTRLFDRLKRWWSLLVALIIVGLLAAAVGDPRTGDARRTGRTLVVLVDVSASMGATDVVPSRFEDARTRVRALIDDLGPNDRMLLAEMANATVPRSPLTGEVAVLRDAVEELAVQATVARLDRGLALAADVLRGAPEPEVVVVTDGRLDLGALAPPEDPDATGDDETGTAADEGNGDDGGEDDPSGGAGPEDGRDGSMAAATAGSAAARARALLTGDDVRFSWIPVGTPDAPNVAITSFAVRRYPLDKSQTEVLLEAWNPTEDPRRVELQLVSEAGPVELDVLELPPGERVRRFFRNVSGADRTLEARLAPVQDAAAASPTGDVLAVDDHAFARLPARRRARVLVVTEGNLYLEAALLLDEYLDVTEVPPSGYPVSGSYDVVIFDGVLPDAPPEAHAIYLGPSPRPDGYTPIPLTDELVERPYFDRVDRDHPLTRFLVLGDVNVAETRRVTPGDDDDVVAADGSGAPLLVTGRRDGRGFVMVPFDLARSDLPLRVAWPLLLLHAIDLFADDSAGFRSSFATGEVWRIPVPAGARRAQVHPPGDAEPREAPVEDGRAVFPGTRVGFHRVVALGDADDGQPLGEELVAANLGPGTESDLPARDTLEVAGRVAAPPSQGSPGARQRAWVWLVALAFLIVAVEWVTYHRRWTV